MTQIEIAYSIVRKLFSDNFDLLADLINEEALGKTYTLEKVLRELKKMCERTLNEINNPLNPREQYVVKSKEEGSTFEKIAQELNITRERARQIYDKALKKLEENNDK